MAIVPFVALTATVGRRSVGSRTVSSAVRAVLAPTSVVTTVKAGIVSFISTATTTTVLSTAAVITVISTAAATAVTPVSAIATPVSVGGPSTAAGGSSPALRRPVTTTALI